LAARGFLAPIHGNLLHHAVEMFLKYGLLDVVSREQMRSRQYGHNLDWLWERFKEKEGDPALVRFDATVHALHEFEELRYPDKIPNRAIMMAITWLRDDTVTSSGETKAKQYEVVIADVDRLIIEILKRVGLNPKFFVQHRVSPSGRDALRYQNPHAADWLS